MNTRPPLNFENSARENFGLKKREFWEVLLISCSIGVYVCFAKIWRLFVFKSQRQIFKRRWLLKIWCAYRSRCWGKKWQKNAKKLHRMGACAQKLTYFNPQQSGKSASEGSKKGVFRAKMAPQDEPFLVVILNTILKVIHKRTTFITRPADVA